MTAWFKQEIDMVIMISGHSVVEMMARDVKLGHWSQKPPEMVWGFMGAVWPESTVDGLEQYFS